MKITIAPEQADEGSVTIDTDDDAGSWHARLSIKPSEDDDAVALGIEDIAYLIAMLQAAMSELSLRKEQWFKDRAPE